MSRKAIRHSLCGEGAGRALAIMLAVGMVSAVPVRAQTGADGADAAGMGDIIVTAQKREQNMQDVGRSIAVLSSDQLVKQGVRSVDQLATAIPALTVTTTVWGTPVLTLRGAGFYSESIAGSPAVSLYVDEVPIGFAVESRGTLFDMERVEVLKGPQGTLFGQNSTGGAINFIAAKPTDKFVAGADISYGRFGALDGTAYVGGRINGFIKARLAFQTQQGGAWQVSRTRGDKLGDRDLNAARLLVDFDGGGPLKARLALSGWVDHSDVMSTQYVLFRPAFPGGPAAATTLPDASYPAASNNARESDWDAGVDLSHHDKRGQVSLRLDYEAADAVTLTSITALSGYKYRFNNDQDGTPFQNGLDNQDGHTRAFFQELRANGTFGPAIATLGVNYEKSRAYENLVQNFSQGTPRTPFPFPVPPSNAIGWNDRHNIESKSVFGNLEVEVTPGVTLKGGARYTDFQRKYSYCLVPGDFAPAFSALTGGVVLPNDCASVGLAPTGPRTNRVLNEDNVSWQGGIQYKPNSDLMVYANISKGYKSGTYDFGLNVFQSAIVPVKQESLLAYEAGFKFSPSRSFTLNAAGFYYDYKNKQIKGITQDPTFGPLTVLIAIPKSRIVGGEIETRWTPAPGLKVSGSATYVDAKVNGDFVNVDTFNNQFNFNGQRLPLTPRFSSDLDVEYRHDLGGMDAYVGGHLNYQSSTDALITDPSDPRAHFLKVPSRALVDVRVGVDKGPYTVELWGRNIFNKFYYTNVVSGADTITRLAGMPATYGIRVSAKY